MAKEIWFVIISYGVLLTVMLLVFVLAINISRHRRMRQQKKLEEMQQAFTKELLQSKVEIKEETLKHVAAELHDNVGHFVTLGLMNLNLNEINNGNNLYVDEATMQLDKALTSLRDISKSMNVDAVLAQGLDKAILSQVIRLRKSSYYEVDFNFDEKIVIENEQHRLIIFRIIQEIITNIVKHSQAKKIDILAKQDLLKQIFTVKDNGRGFDVESVLKDTSKVNGLLNMMNRATLIGGKILIESSANGTTISLHYPQSKN